MGQEICYCFKCSTRIIGTDSYSVGGRATCATCASSLLDTLPPREREELETQMIQTATAKSRPPSKRTPSRGTEAVPPRPPAPRSPVIPIAVACAVGVVLLVAALGRSPSRPAPEPPPPVERRTERPVVDRPPPPPPPIPRVNFDAELARIDDSIAGASRQEDFKEALGYLASARKRHDEPDWGFAIDRRISRTNDEIQALFVSLEKKAVDGRRKGAEAEVREVVDRVGRWNLPDRAAALRKSIDAVVVAAFRQGADGVVCVEAEHSSARTDASGHAWTPVRQPEGCEGDGALAALPNDGTQFLTNFAASSPRLDYRIEFQKAGVHYLWVRGCAPTDKDNSVHSGLDGVPLESLNNVSFSATGKWAWTNKRLDGKVAAFSVPSAGPHTIQLWMREDGAVLDRFVITSDPKWSPKGSGPAESPR